MVLQANGQKKGSTIGRKGRKSVSVEKGQVAGLPTWRWESPPEVDDLKDSSCEMQGG